MLKPPSGLRPPSKKPPGDETIDAHLERLIGRMGSRLSSDVRKDPMYRFEVVPPQKFFSDAYYCGTAAASLWPKVKEELVNACHTSFREFICGGATSIGKTYRAALFAEYRIYELMCLDSMQLTLGLDETSHVYVCVACTSQKKARKTAFAQLQALIKTSPWFREHAPPKADIDTQIAWPDRGLFVEPIISAEDGALGYNLIGLIIDEINELQAVQRSTRARTSSGHYDPAEEIYEVGRNRQFQRFFAEGQRFWPFIALASSSEREQDFLCRRRSEVEKNKDDKVYISWLSLWDAKPKGTFSEETFRIEIGDNRRLHRFLKEGDEPTKGALVVHPPVSLYGEARRDLGRFVRRACGIAISGVSPLIVNRPALFKMARPRIHDHLDDCRCLGCMPGQHPYSTQSTFFGDGHRLLVDHLVEIVNGLARPRVDPEFARVIHIDTAATQDCLGLCMSHPTRLRPVETMLPDGRMTVDLQPGAYIDFILQVRCPPDQGAEISFESVAQLVIEIADAGVPIGLITMDTWQTKMLKQRFENHPKHRIPCEILSVDKSTEPYFTLRELISTERISCYYYDQLWEELLGLEIDPVRRKVDHPVKGSKDCADAVAGSVYTAVTRYDELICAPTRMNVEGLG